MDARWILRARKRPKQICSVRSRAHRSSAHAFLRLPVSLLPDEVNRMRRLVNGNGRKESWTRIERWVHACLTSFAPTRASRLKEMFFKEIRNVVASCYSFLRRPFSLVESVTLAWNEFSFFFFRKDGASKSLTPLTWSFLWSYRSEMHDFGFSFALFFGYIIYYLVTLMSFLILLI